MKDDVLIKVEGVSKKFCKDLKTGLWYGVKDLATNLRGKNAPKSLRSKEFWALQDVNFELRRGECLGLIGHNGAGKSTLLKILNGLIMPDAGRVTIKGRVGALIELGAGFNGVLTGRENIYNNGAILGFSKLEIDSKLETIIEFAELEEFIDMPVQHYSSGMRERLGFAIAAQMEPDVLLIDEVLAVGDLGFVLKCFKAMDRILPNTAIIFVSHSMPMVSRICNKVLLLDNGMVTYYNSNVANAIDAYYRKFAVNNSAIVFTDNTLKLVSYKVISKSVEKDVAQIKWGETLEFLFKFEILENIESLQFMVMIIDKEQRPVALLERNKADIVLNKSKGCYTEFKVSHKNIQLSKGVYSVNLAVRKTRTKEPVYRVNDLMTFQLIHKDETWEPFLLRSTFEI